MFFIYTCRMIEGGLTAKTGSSGPYSRSLSRGTVGDAVDGRSREGRFLRQSERGLLDQLGGEALFTQRALIRRAARLMLAVEIFDGRLAKGYKFTPQDTALFASASGALHEVLRELGLPQTSSSALVPPDPAASAARGTIGVSSR